MLGQIPGISAKLHDPELLQKLIKDKTAYQKLQNIIRHSLLWLSGLMETLSVPTSFNLASPQMKIHMGNLSNRHRDQEHKDVMEGGLGSEP